MKKICLFLFIYLFVCHKAGNMQEKCNVYLTSNKSQTGWKCDITGVVALVLLKNVRVWASVPTSASPWLSYKARIVSYMYMDDNLFTITQNIIKIPSTIVMFLHVEHPWSIAWISLRGPQRVKTMLWHLFFRPTCTSERCSHFKPRLYNVMSQNLHMTHTSYTIQLTYEVEY